MAKLFFLLSGENPTLPFSEVQAILEAEGYKYRILENLTQVLRVEAEVDCVRSIESRASMTRLCGSEIFRCQANLEQILENVEGIGWDEVLTEGESFVVRVKRVRGNSPKIERWRLEQKIGGMVFKKAKNSRVDLKTPHKTFLGIITDGKFILGLKIAEIKPKSFLERNPKKRVFFHPTAMPAKLARCMVNLAQPRKGDLVLDPFCGTGSFLVEAGLIGCHVLGIDVRRYTVKGCMQNLSFYNVEPKGVFVADARFVPVKEESIDCVVTDPPYGISATTMGLRTVDLIEGFLSNIINKIRRGRRMCLAAPKSLKVDELAEKVGFKHLESHFVYVHRRLTREIIVLLRD